MTTLAWVIVFVTVLFIGVVVFFSIRHERRMTKHLKRIARKGGDN